MTFTEKTLFLVVALLVAVLIVVGARHIIGPPGCYVVSSASGFVVGYYCDKLWRRWNK